MNDFYAPLLHYVIETSQRIHKKIQNIGMHKSWGCAIALNSLWSCMGRGKCIKGLLLELWFLSPIVCLEKGIRIYR